MSEPCQAHDLMIERLNRIDRGLERIATRLEDLPDTTARLRIVERIAYSSVGLVLVAVGAAILSLVVRHPQP